MEERKTGRLGDEGRGGDRGKGDGEIRAASFLVW